MFKSYIRYIKDNPKGYWFKAKWYGWGWTPVTWQGWLSLVIYLGFVLWSASLLPFEEDTLSDSELLWFIAKLILSTTLIIIVAYLKGEKPHWSWGKPKSD